MELNSIIGDVGAFIDSIVDALMSKGIDITKNEIDHVCYRCKSIPHYLQTIKSIVEEKKLGFVESECMIGGRPITTITLYEPIKHKGFSITCIEVPCPKKGRPYEAGLEHAEVVIGDKDDLPVNNKDKLIEFTKKYSSVSFDTRAIDKEHNADVSLELSSKSSVKFHLCPLYKVCKYEIEHNCITPVPADYFN